MPDAFDILDVEPVYDLDMELLHRRLITLAAQAHPDRLTDPFEQAEAAERSAQINDAYRQLSDPQRRAEALLARLSSGPVSDDKALPPDLLMGMMEVREAMEDAVASSDAEALARLSQWAQSQKEQHLQRIAERFDQWLGQAIESDAAAAATRMDLNALRYFQRMLDQMPEL